MLTDPEADIGAAFQAVYEGALALFRGSGLTHSESTILAKFAAWRAAGPESKRFVMRRMRIGRHTYALLEARIEEVYSLLFSDPDEAERFILNSGR